MLFRSHVVSTGWGNCTHSQSFDEFVSRKFPPKTDRSLWGHPTASEVARSNSHGFVLWGYLKDNNKIIIIIKDNNQFLVALKENIRREIGSIEPSLLQRVAQNSRLRFEQRVQLDGRHLDDILFKK